MQHNSGGKNHKNLKISYLRLQSHFKSEMGIAYFFVKIAAPWFQSSHIIHCLV